jgi:arylsulfatase A-like enzyme
MKVLLIVPHGLGVGYLGCYGNEWVSTPHIDSLASEGIVFDQHFADHPDGDCGCQIDLSAHCQAGVPGKELERVSGPSAFARAINSAGVASVLIHTSDIALDDPGESWQHVEVVDLTGDSEEDGQSLCARIRRAMDQLSARSDWLMRIDIATSAFASPDTNADTALDSDTDDVIDETRPVDEDEESADDVSVGSFSDSQMIYASAVSEVDQIVGSVCAYLRKAEWIDDVMIVLTSFRGMETDEIASFRKWNQPFLHEELVHVPLIIRMPAGAAAGRRMDVLTQPCDLLPTLCEAFGFPTGEVNRHSLLPLIAGKTNIIREFAYSSARCHGFDLRAIRSRDWCLLECLPSDVTASEDDLSARRLLLFEKPADRWEVSDLSNVHPDTVDQLQTVLHKFASTPRNGPSSAEHTIDLPGSE